MLYNMGIYIQCLIVTYNGKKPEKKHIFSLPLLTPAYNLTIIIYCHPS